MCFMKPVIWIGVAGTLAAGTALAVMGPHRAHAFINQARSNINAAVDSHIDDPIALREQLRDLEAQYPGRIAAVKGDLAELTSQIGQLERDQVVSQRVVALASADLQQLQGMLAQAGDRQAQNGYALVKIRFDNESLSLEEAYNEAEQIQQLRSAYASKADDIDGNLSVLRQQAQRLNEILAQLEGERADFQAQLWQLDRQVDAIARNDRMIEMLEKRQKAFDKYDRYGEVASPDHIEAQIAKVLAEQEAKLNAFTVAASQNDYERQAKADLAKTELSYQLEVGAGSFQTDSVIEFEPEVIEITPEDAKAPKGPIASNN